MVIALLPAMLAAVILNSARPSTAESQVRPARTVKVLPIFFVPKESVPPTEDQAKSFMRHVDWAQRRYRELLPGHVTFGVASRHPLVYRALETLAFYRAQPDLGAPSIAAELLDHLKFTRCNCPYVMLVLVMNPVDDYPGGGGQPLNGGFNTGGSIVVLPSSGLGKFPNLQSSMQHELGHAFGLPHVDVYGYDMGSNGSLMSYNMAHMTKGFTPSPTPGTLIPEDIRALALNQRVFRGLTFDPDRDVPKGYQIAKKIMGLGAAEIPGQLDLVKITTDSGEADGSKAAALLVGQLVPIEAGGKPVFDTETMWRSAPTRDGWVSLQVTLPLQVPLTRIAVHTMPLGETDAALAVRISVQDSANAFRVVAGKDLETADDALRFRKTSGRIWKLEFRTAPGKSVVVRGIEYFSGGEELFPPLAPFKPLSATHAR